jgi:hypothetical protein
MVIVPGFGLLFYCLPLILSVFFCARLKKHRMQELLPPICAAFAAPIPLWLGLSQAGTGFLWLGICVCVSVLCLPGPLKRGEFRHGLAARLAGFGACLFYFFSFFQVFDVSL